jgi:DNA-directed RNA polymerase specialized sigma subunit
MGVGGDDTSTVRDDAREIVRSTATWLPSDDRIEVRPGDPSRAAEVEGWLRDYATGRDPHLRARIVLAYLGLADRLAARYRASHGTTLEDLTQTARAGLIAAVDRHDPGHRGGFVPFAVASVVGELKRYLRDTSWRVSLDQSAIAARIGYSQMHVSRLLRRALARMRARLLEP